jgi:hypothetical protein
MSLTKKQKSLLHDYLKENPEVYSIRALDMEFYYELETIRDSEVLYTDIDRFIWDERMK